MTSHRKRLQLRSKTARDGGRKPLYAPPKMVPLGQLARGLGGCVPGTGAPGSCNYGGGASHNCIAGTLAFPDCKTGTLVSG
jgi:hypothetical protein